MRNCRLCGQIVESTLAECPHCHAPHAPDAPRDGPDWAVIVLAYACVVVSCGVGLLLALGLAIVWGLVNLIFGRSHSSRSEDATTRRLTMARAVGGFAAAEGIGILRFYIGTAAAGPQAFAGGLILLGGLSAYYAHRSLKLNRQREQAFDLSERT